MADSETTSANSVSEPIREIDVLWINAGLSCDGDTIAMTAATQPSIEDLVLGNLPWIPKVNFHNLFLTYENGDEFLLRFHRAAEGGAAPFILVVEGSIPDETNKAEGYWGPWEPTAKPDNRLRPASGSTGWLQKPGRSWRRVPARLTAESMRWRAIPRAVWGSRIIWDGAGNPARVSPLSVFPGVRYSPTISWRLCSIS